MTSENAASNGKGMIACKICRREQQRVGYYSDLDRSRRSVRERMRKHRGPEKGNWNGQKTHCAQGHEYSAENTYVTPSGSRQCKTCRKVRVVESWHRHKAKRSAEARAWRAANPERARGNMRRWVEANRERYNLAHRLKKQRRRAGGTLTNVEWQLVLDIYGTACLACGDGTVPITIDHIVPTSQGGKNVISNVQPLCGWCNTSKHTKTIDYRPVPWAELPV